MISILKPSFRYSIRLYILLTLVGIILLGIGVVIAWLYYKNGDRAVVVNGALQAFIIFVLLGYLISLVGANMYYRGLIYELHVDSINLHRKFWIQSEQRIDLQAVAGITIKRDILDRWLEIGTLEFILFDSRDHMPGNVKLVGIPDVNEGYRKISNHWLRFWGEQLSHFDKVEEISPGMMENPFRRSAHELAFDDFERQFP